MYKEKSVFFEIIYCIGKSREASDPILTTHLQSTSNYVTGSVHSMSLTSTPISIKPSSTELESGRLDQKNLEIAIRALQRDGLVVLEDLVPHSMLDKLNKKMVEDAYELQKKKDSPYNYHKGNIQQDPLLNKEFFFEEVYTSMSTCYSSFDNLQRPHST